jgi:diguanylate cyclase (GGDEF)-like protein/PAS domain S-box-containing protein
MPRKPRKLLDRKGTAWLVLVVSLLVTLGAWRYSEQHFEQLARERFLLLAESGKDVLVERMADYEQVLRGGAALFAANGDVGRERWRDYIAGLELDKYLPGILGTGFSLMIPPEAVTAHEEAIRAEGFPDYRVHPAGAGDSISSIVYLEPFTGRNLRAFGFDMYTDPVRREAMERARDTGLPALSGKVTLVQETRSGTQPGFLMYMPVYRSGMRTDTVESRRSALHGFVYSPFRAFDLMREIFDSREQDVQIELFDGNPAPENRLFDSGIGTRAADHVTDMTLEIAGHFWVARFHSSLAFEASRAGVQPPIILFGGLTLDLLLFAVLYMNARHRHRMHDAAVALEQSRDSYRTLVENIPGAVFRSKLEDNGKIQHVSIGIQALTGEPRERYLSGEVAYDELIHPEDRPQVQFAIEDAIVHRAAYRIEYRIRASDGHTRWVAESGRAIYSETGRPQWLDGVILDIDDRKRAEMAIHELAFQDALTGLPNRRLLLDRLEHQLAVSGRTGRPGALLFLDMDNFKTINDTLGHNVGDKLLNEVAHRLRSHVRESDTVARLGGDEFVVLLDELGEGDAHASSAAADIARKILEELNRPYQLGKHRCVSTPSIGIALFRGHETSPDRLLRRADQAMYNAKSAGRNRVVFYEEIGTPTDAMPMLHPDGRTDSSAPSFSVSDHLNLPPESPTHAR